MNRTETAEASDLAEWRKPAQVSGPIPDYVAGTLMRLPFFAILGFLGLLAWLQ